MRIYAIVGTTPNGKQRFIGLWARRHFAETKLAELSESRYCSVKGKYFSKKNGETFKIVTFLEEEE